MGVLYSNLASKVLNEIIQILKEEKRLKKHYIELLITQQLAVLDLSREAEDVTHSLQLASIRCPVSSYLYVYVYIYIYFLNQSIYFFFLQ